MVRRTFASFERNGIRLSVDDVGTGFSNLMYLHRFPVRQLKIDRNVVSPMLSDLQVVVLTRAIISLAHAMGLTVIAEGVEDANPPRVLHNQGCDEARRATHSRDRCCPTPCRMGSAPAGPTLDTYTARWHGPGRHRTSTHRRTPPPTDHRLTGWRRSAASNMTASSSVPTT